MTIDELNDMAERGFVRALGTVYEHSPWIAARSFALRPFTDIAGLADAMARSVANASVAEQDGLIVAHPDLAGRLARAGGLEPASAGEQAGLGLDRLSDQEFEDFDALNRAYRARFGFPFVIAVKRHTRASVLAAFALRLQNDKAAERRTALREINMIARLRLDAMLGA